MLPFAIAKAVSALMAAKIRLPLIKDARKAIELMLEDVFLVETMVLLHIPNTRIKGIFHQLSVALVLVPVENSSSMSFVRSVPGAINAQQICHGEAWNLGRKNFISLGDSYNTGALVRILGEGIGIVPCQLIGDFVVGVAF